MSVYANILLVEDDQALAQWIKDYLKNEGFRVDHVARGDVVEQQIKQHDYDLVLLDLMLPGLDGLEVCRRVRRFSHLPIIMLTAKVDEFDEVIGLEIGANDYVTKPVRPRALLARIKTILRNKSQQQHTNDGVLQFGELTIEKAAKRVVLEGQEVQMSNSLFDFLWLLGANAGEVVDRETVFQRLKSREYDGLDRRFDVMVSSLRKLLFDNPQNPERIKTVWGKGYLFVADAWGPSDKNKHNTDSDSQSNGKS